jgi:hypothetical protein
MEILVAILVIALIVGAAVVVMQRRAGGARRLGGPRTSASGQARRSPRTDPMTAAVVEHARVTDPDEVRAAEQRLRAHAQQIAAPLQAQANHVEQQRAADAGEPVEPAADEPYGDLYDPRYDGNR